VPICVAEIGGTNTCIEFSQNQHLLPSSIRSFRNAGVPRCEQLLDQYLAEQEAKEIQVATVAVAGSLANQTVNLSK